ncbi:hypothetical protein C8F01DRAFT_1231075 [Mycena amicta]|nr:hypothetical protein C8F01DRAFT_1231075 [Mycena amicta]
MLALELLTRKRDSDSSSTTTTRAVLASLVFPNTDNDASGSPPTSAKSDLAKEIIEWVFVGIVIILICTFFMRKLFFEPRSRTRTTHSNDDSDFDDTSAWARGTEPTYVLGFSHPYPGVLYPAAAVVRARNDQPDSDTRGFGIGIAMVETRREDARLGLGFDGTNVHMHGGSKDFLPVYEAAGGPPAYIAGGRFGENHWGEKRINTQATLEIGPFATTTGGLVVPLSSDSPAAFVHCIGLSRPVRERVRHNARESIAGYKPEEYYQLAQSIKRMNNEQTYKLGPPERSGVPVADERAQPSVSILRGENTFGAITCCYSQCTGRRWPWHALVVDAESKQVSVDMVLVMRWVLTESSMARDASGGLEDVGRTLEPRPSALRQNPLVTPCIPRPFDSSASVLLSVVDPGHSCDKVSVRHDSDGGLEWLAVLRCNRWLGFRSSGLVQFDDWFRWEQWLTWNLDSDTETGARRRDGKRGRERKQRGREQRWREALRAAGVSSKRLDPHRQFPDRLCAGLTPCLVRLVSFAERVAHNGLQSGGGKAVGGAVNYVHGGSFHSVRT